MHLRLERHGVTMQFTLGRLLALKSRTRFVAGVLDAVCTIRCVYLTICISLAIIMRKLEIGLCVYDT